MLTNWAKDSKADGKILMLADGSAEFAKKIGLEIDLGARGLGTRSKRYSMVVEDGVVKALNLEDAPPNHDKSSAANCARCRETAEAGVGPSGCRAAARRIHNPGKVRYPPTIFRP